MVDNDCSRLSAVKVACTPEILSTFISSVGDKESFKEDPRGYLCSHYNMQLDQNFDLRVVENSRDNINLSLPYYSALRNKAESLVDTDLSEADGAVASLLVVIGVAVAVLAGSGAVGLAGLVGGVSAKYVKNNK